MQSNGESNIEDQVGNQKITIANEENLNDIVKLNQQFHLDIKGFEWDQPEYIKDEIEKGNYFIIKQNGQVVGAIDIRKPEGGELYIEAIAVEPNKHSSGIGKKLINFAKDTAQKAGCNRLTVESFQFYNLQGFYQKVGFESDNPPVGHHEGEPFYRFVIHL